jgi:YHS domain-containing protein
MEHLVRDLICGKTLDWQRTVVLAYKGRLHYFCCLGCLEKFKKSPQRYLCRECKSCDRIETGDNIIPIRPHAEGRLPTSRSKENN